ncbi:MAG: hypothetical protein E7451_00305 [Ruminococcaceae bacterium]|nr:hypothetical protein [Oscillospiraceae bacterium]
MKDKKYTLNTILTVVFALELLVMKLVRAFGPNIILPLFDPIHMVTLSLVVLVLDHYLAPGAKRSWIAIPVFALLTFYILPQAAMLIPMMATGEVLWVLSSSAIFTATTWVFTSIQDRLSTGPAARFAPVVSAVGIWLAIQAFAGMGL